jgi:nicotinate-nucleotide adenylyltransferase
VKYCIYGGSFDPPHAGHRYLADSALATLALDQVIWVPATDPPLKTRPSTPFRHRLAMVRLAIAGRPGQIVSDIEDRLPKPSYTIRTIDALKAEHGAEHAWYLLIGADNWAVFPKWHRPADVLKAVTVVVFPRTGFPLGDLPPGVLRIDRDRLDMESTSIRGGLLAGETSAEERLLPEIRAYARDQGLYGLKGR